MLFGIKDKVAQYGFSRGIIRALKHVLRKIGITYEQFLFCTLQLEKEKIVVKKQPLIDIEVKELTLDDLRNSTGIVFPKKEIDKFTQKLVKKTYVPLGCLYKNKLIYVAWISLKDFEIPYPCSQDIYTLKEDEGLLIDAYCHPRFRGFGLHTYMNTMRLKKMYELEKRGAVAVILKENIPARKSQAKVGFKCKMLITCVRILWFSCSKIIEKRISLA